MATRASSPRQLQQVQSFDGGVVSEILVQEGQVVERDQLLLKIDETRATSGVRESAARASRCAPASAAARAGRGHGLRAAGGRRRGETRIVTEERRLYETRQTELGTLLAINRQQLQQREQELPRCAPGAARPSAAWT